MGGYYTMSWEALFRPAIGIIESGQVENLKIRQIYLQISDIEARSCLFGPSSGLQCTTWVVRKMKVW